jgi:glycosyltransferase involved in cell wall biosynthesis
MANPRISIVMGAYNHEKFVAKTLAGIRAQTFANWELVAVDDGSPDRTGAILDEFESQDKRIRVFHQQNKGVSITRNRGIASISANSEFISFIDSDDVWEPDALETLLSALEKNKEAVGAHGIARYIDAKDELYHPGEMEQSGRARHGFRNGRLIDWPLCDPTTFEVLIWRDCIPAGGVLLRRAVLDAVGNYDTATTPAEDWDLYLRACAHGDFVFVDKVVYNFRQHGNNLSHNEERMRAAEQVVRRKSMALAELNTERREIALLAWRLSERKAARARLQWAGGALLRGQFIHAAKQFRHGAISYARSLGSAH